MKILVLTDNFPPLHKGGASKVAYNLSKKFKEKGHSVFIVTTTSQKDKAGKVSYKGLEVRRIYNSYHSRWRAYLSLYNPRISKKIRKIVKDVDPDVVHAHNIHYHLTYHSLKISKESGAKVFLTAHDGMMVKYGKIHNFINREEPPFEYKITFWDQIKKAQKRYNPFRNLIIRFYLNFVDKIVAVSKSLKTALQNNGIDKKVDVIYNGIDLSKWKVSNKRVKKFKKKYNLESRKIILHAGRISQKKGSFALLRAIKKAREKYPKIVLLVLSSVDRYRNKMKEKVEEMGLSKNVINTGWIKNQKKLAAAYHTSDIATVPSIYLEPFGLVALEAFACRRPSIVSCFGGCSGIVDDGKDGYIINPLNTEEFSNKVVELLKNNKKRKKFGASGFRKIKENFTLEKKAKEYIDLFYSY